MNSTPTRILDSHCLFGRWPKDSRDASLGKLLEVLGGLGIEKGVCASLRGVFYDHALGNAETLSACAGNRRLLSTMESNSTGASGSSRTP